TGAVVTISDAAVTSPGKQFAAFTGIEAVALLAATTVTVFGDHTGPAPSAANDVVTLTKAAGVFQFVINGLPLNAPTLAAASGKPLAGSDCLISAPSMLNTAPLTSGLTFDGGAGTDAVSVTGTGAEAAVYTPDAAAASAGRLDVGANKLTFT